MSLAYARTARPDARRRRRAAGLDVAAPPIMTPFRTDPGNPFARRGLWPHPPQAPLGLRGDTIAAMDARVVAEEARLFSDSRDFIGPEDFAGDLELEFGQPPAPAAATLHGGLRLAPMIGATATGLVGLTVLFLALGGPALP